MSFARTWSLLAGAAATLVQAGLALVAAYDAVVSLAGSRRPPVATPAGPRLRRFAIVVPARDEGAVIERLLASLEELTYPPDRFQVFVVADNCADDTAARARARGARVFERLDCPPGKAVAIGWLYGQVANEGLDAFAVVDADSVVSVNLLDVMDDCLEAGYDAVQVHGGVLNAGESALTALAAIGLELNNRIRPAGRQALRLSSGLMGNGMALSAHAMGLVDWGGLGATEDSEAHLALLRDGYRICFDQRATVLSDLPGGWAEAREQNSRWDSGRLRVARAELADSGRGGRNVRYLVAVADQAIPRSVLIAANIALTVLLALGGRRAPATFGAAILGMQALAVAPAIAQSPRGVRAAALRAAPAFLAWKSYLFLRLLAGLLLGTGDATPGRQRQ